jgi:hypothetical protein
MLFYILFIYIEIIIFRVYLEYICVLLVICSVILFYLFIYVCYFFMYVDTIIRRQLR